MRLSKILLRSAGVLLLTFLAVTSSSAQPACSITLNAGEEGSDELKRELVQEVRHDIGALAAPEKIHFTPALPKTRSGKIMRRILRKIAEGATEGFGDTSTLADPTIVDALVAGRQ